MADEPTWLNAAPAAPAPAPKTVPQSTSRSSSASRPSENVSDMNRSGDIGPPEPGKNICMMVCFIFNAGIGLMVAANGAMAIGHKSNNDDLNVLFVGLYMVIFAAILIIFELLQLCPVEALDTMYKRNFGFLYGVFGKCFYLLFVGILAFGLGSYPDWSVATPICAIIWAIAQALLYMMRPKLFPIRQKYSPNF